MQRLTILKGIRGEPIESWSDAFSTKGTTVTLFEEPYRLIFSTLDEHIDTISNTPRIDIPEPGEDESWTLDIIPLSSRYEHRNLSGIGTIERPGIILWEATDADAGFIIDFPTLTDPGDFIPENDLVRTNERASSNKDVVLQPMNPLLGYPEVKLRLTTDHSMNLETELISISDTRRSDHAISDEITFDLTVSLSDIWNENREIIEHKDMLLAKLEDLMENRVLLKVKSNLTIQGDDVTNIATNLLITEMELNEIRSLNTYEATLTLTHINVVQPIEEAWMPVEKDGYEYGAPYTDKKEVAVDKPEEADDKSSSFWDRLKWW